MQGFDPVLSDFMPSQDLKLKGSGNSYPPPLIGAILAPLLNILSGIQPTTDFEKIEVAMAHAAVFKVPKSLRQAKTEAKRVNAATSSSPAKRVKRK